MTPSIDTCRPSCDPYRSFKSQHRSPAGSSVRVIVRPSLVYHYFEFDNFPNEWSRYSDSQKVNVFLFGSSHLSTEEDAKIFSYAQQVQTLFFLLKALFIRDVICMLYVSCRCKPSR